MLASSATMIVIVLVQSIRPGSLTADGGTTPKEATPWSSSLTCHSDGAVLETEWVERDKPHKREIQIW